MLEDGVRYRRMSQVKNSIEDVPKLTYSKYVQFETEPTKKYVSYVDRVPLARRKKPDSWFVVCAEIFLVCAAIFGSYATYYYVDRLHIPITRFYAKMGATKAQSILGQRLLQNAAGQEDLDEAMHWIRKAAQNGDPISNYNFAVAHLKDHVIHNRLDDQEIMQMINHAAKHGINEAKKLQIHCNANNQCPKLSSALTKNRQITQ